MTRAAAVLRLVAIRHAPALTTGLCYGRCDVAVSLTAEEAAARIVSGVHGTPLDRVWSSPAARCLGPAEIVAQTLGLPLCIDPQLAELSFGAWEGRPWKKIEVADRRALERWMSAWETVGPPGGESAGQLEERVREWYQRLAPGESHLLVGHAGVLRALLVVTGRCDWLQAMRREVPSLVPERFDDGTS